MWSSAVTAFRYIRHETRTFAQTESGVTSIEYALIAALIAIVIVASVSNVGTAVLGLYQFVANNVAAAM